MRSLVGVPVVAALLMTGCGGRECGKGTVRDGNSCRQFDSDDKSAPNITVNPPTRTRFVGNVTLTSNEPAIIYYTLDGTTPTTASANEPNHVLIPDMPDDTLVTYFAVDKAGNASDVQEARWEIDRAGPRTRSLSLTLAGDARNLAWEAPSNGDLAGMVLARIDGRLGAGPADETMYEAGNIIAPGLTVVYAGPVTPGETGVFSETLSTPVGGMVRYAAWAYDDLGNYGPGVADYETQSLPAQTGTLSVDVATGVVDAVQPVLFHVVGSSTLVGTTLSVHLALENRTTRVVFAPKLVLANIAGTVGGSWNDSDGSIGPNDYRSYGSAIAPGASLVRTYTFINVLPTEVIDASFSVETGRVLGTTFWDEYASGSITDEAVNQMASILGPAPQARGPAGNLSMRSAGITPDGFYIMGSRVSARVVAFDLTTGLPAMGVTLAPQSANVSRLVVDRAGMAIYALVTPGHPYSQRLDETQQQAENVLVRLDAGTLRETGRLPIGIAAPSADLRLSPDERSLSIVTRSASRVVVVDLEEWSVADTFVSTGARASAWSPNGSFLHVVSNSAVRTHSTATGFPKTGEFAIPSLSRVMRAAFVADGRLWVGRENELQMVDVGTGVVLPIDNYDGVSLEVYDGDAFVAGSGDSQVYRMNNSGVEVMQYDFDDSNYGHHIARSPF